MKRLTVLLVGMAALLVTAGAIAARNSEEFDVRSRLVLPMVARDSDDSAVYRPTATPAPPVYPPIVPCRHSPQLPLQGRIAAVRVVQDSPDGVQFAIDYVWDDPASPVCIAIYMLRAPFPGGVGFGTAGQLPEVPPASSGTVLIRAECAVIRFHGGGGEAFFAAGFFAQGLNVSGYRDPVIAVSDFSKTCP